MFLMKFTELQITYQSTQSHVVKVKDQNFLLLDMSLSKDFNQVIIGPTLRLEKCCFNLIKANRESSQILLLKLLFKGTLNQIQRFTVNMGN